MVKRHESTMEREFRGRVDQSGRLVIPASFRKALGIEAGGDVVMHVHEKELRISTQRARIERAQQRAQRYLRGGKSLVDELLEERRREAASDER